MIGSGSICKYSEKITKYLEILPKNFVKKSLKSLKNEKLCIKMQSMSVFLDIAQFADFLRKNAGFSRTQGVCHVVHIFFGSSLGKV